MSDTVSSECAGMCVDRTGPADAPKIIAVHGFADDRAAFAPLSRTALTRSFELIAVDLPGFGQSASMGGQSGTLNDLAHTLLTLADAVSADAPVGLIGHSVGAPIAVQAARLASHRVAGVLSLEGNLTEQDAYFSGQAAHYDDAETFKAAFLSKLTEMATQDQSLGRYLATVPSAQATGMWRLGRDAAVLGRGSGFGQAYLDLAALGVDTHYLWGRHSTPAMTAEYLKRQKGLAQTELPEAGHWIAEDAPQDTAEIALSLFQSLLASDANRL